MRLKRFITVFILLGFAPFLIALVPFGTTGIGNASTMSALPSEMDRSDCRPVGGVLMTNINAISGTTPEANMGPVFGDLAGSVAAVPLTGQVGYHHYWVTSTGDSIYFNDAILHADPSDFVQESQPNPIIAVRWGHYRSAIVGGTGKFEGATGYLDYSGLADFNASTLVLRYRGKVCYAH